MKRPPHQSPVASRAAGNDLPPPSAESCVAVVDDYDDLRSAVIQLLTSAGCYARGFPSAIHALRYLEAHPAAVVVADQKMPGPTGVKLLQTVKQRWPRTRRIILAGNPWALPPEADVYAHRVIGKGAVESQLLAAVLAELREWTHGR